MFVVGALLSWWYGLGWARLIQRVGARVRGVLEFFSVGELAGSLFAPFKQLSAGQAGSTPGDWLRALGDRIFSRFMGAAVRSVLILAGLASALVVGVVGVVLIAAWPFLPVLPIVGILLIQVGLG